MTTPTASATRRAAAVAARAGRALVVSGSAVAVALSLHSLLNTRFLLRPRDVPPDHDLTERVSVLVPARDEETTVGHLLADLATQRGVPDLEILILDDRSTDTTADVVRTASQRDHRVRLLAGEDPPPGRLGKPHACAALAREATGTVLVFVDADVRLRPHAVATTVALLRHSRLDILSPYPRPVAGSPAERLVQPLLAWSWLTTLPLGWAARSHRPSLSAANGQLLAVDTAAYRAAGGHDAVADRVLEDISLMRAVKAAGGRGVPADGSRIAECRMYDSWPGLRDGYTKSLWEAFRGPVAATTVMGVLVLAYVLPPLAALGGSRVGLAGYAAAVAGRAVTARASGSRAWPDALAHPVGIALAAWLTSLSWRRKRRGTLTWKGRGL